MAWLAEHALQLGLILAYFAVIVHHALIGRRESASVDGYLVAGRKMGGVVIGLSFYATFMSTNTFIGAAGKSWDYGLVWCMGGFVLTTMACLSWFVVAPRFVPLTRQYQSLTVADFLGSHYESDAVRRLAGLLVAFASVLYLVAIYRGASLALHTFLAIPYAWSVVVAAVIVTCYTLTGGFKSVVLTDAAQGVVMLIGAVALFVALLSSGGGWDTMFGRLRKVDPSLTSISNGAAWSAAFAYSLAVGVKYLVEPRQLSRLYGLRDDRAMRTASWIAPAAILLSYMCLLPIGAMARATIDPTAIADSDQVIPFLLGPGNVLGPLMGTVFLLVLVSAAMSSIDSVLLVAASTISRDTYRLSSICPAPADSRNEVRRTRFWIVVVSLAAASVALLPGDVTRDIVRMTKFSGSLYGACFLPVLVVGLFIHRPPAAAALATMSGGALCVIIVFVLRWMELTQMQEVYPGIAVGLLLFFALARQRRKDRVS